MTDYGNLISKYVRGMKDYIPKLKVGMFVAGKNCKNFGGNYRETKSVRTDYDDAITVRSSVRSFTNYLLYLVYLFIFLLQFVLRRPIRISKRFRFQNLQQRVGPLRDRFEVCRIQMQRDHSDKWQISQSVYRPRRADLGTRRRV